MKDVIDHISNGGTRNFIGFKTMYTTMNLFLDAFMGKAQANKRLFQVMNASCRMLFIEQFLEENEILLSDAMAQRFRDAYLAASTHLAKHFDLEELTGFVSRDALIKESADRYERIKDKITDEGRRHVMEEFLKYIAQ
jgi:hypothetical protein